MSESENVARIIDGFDAGGTNLSLNSANKKMTHACVVCLSLF